MELPLKMQWFHKLFPWWPLGSLPIPVCILPVTTFPLKSPGSMLSLSLSLSHSCVEPPGMCSRFASSWKPACPDYCRYIDCRQGWVHLFYVPQYVVEFLVVIVCLSLLPSSSTPPLIKSYPRTARSPVSSLITGSGGHSVSFPSAVHSDRHIVGAQ